MKRVTKSIITSIRWMIENQINSRIIEGKSSINEIEFKRLYRKALSFAEITEHEDSVMHKARNRNKDPLWIRQVVKEVISQLMNK